MNNIDIFPFIESTYIITFTYTAFMKNSIDCPGMIIYIQPITYILSLPYTGSGLLFLIFVIMLPTTAKGMPRVWPWKTPAPKSACRPVPRRANRCRPPSCHPAATDRPGHARCCQRGAGGRLVGKLPQLVTVQAAGQVPPPPPPPPLPSVPFLCFFAVGLGPAQERRDAPTGDESADEAGQTATRAGGCAPCVSFNAAGVIHERPPPLLGPADRAGCGAASTAAPWRRLCAAHLDGPPAGGAPTPPEAPDPSSRRRRSDPDAHRMDNCLRCGHDRGENGDVKRRRGG